jgi:Fic family protein
LRKISLLCRKTAKDFFRNETGLSRPGSTVMAARLFEMLPRHPVLTIAGAMKLLGTTRPTAAKAVATLAETGVLASPPGKKRDRVFAYTAYLDILKAGTGLQE